MSVGAIHRYLVGAPRQLSSGGIFIVAASAIAPGARVLIRDAEWIVKRVDRTGTGGQSIQVVGVSEIVRHKEARFLSEIEGKSITVLDPAETELVADTSPQFRNSRLYLESLLRQSPPTGNDLWIGHRAAIDDLPYQLDPALAGARSTAPAHTDGRRRRPRQDHRDGHPAQRTDQPRQGQAHPGGHHQEHDGPVPEGALVAVHHPAGPSRIQSDSNASAAASPRTRILSIISTKRSSPSTP